jgi:esterase/lipase superfamily enzyme
MPITYYRGISALYGSVDRNLRTTFYDKARWDVARLERLRLAGPGTPVLFIHGYNNSHDEALLRGFAVADSIGPDFPVVVLSWPSYASRRRYVWDEANAEWSSATTRPVIEDLAKQGRSPIILAHSMGNRIALDALRHYRVRTGNHLPIERLIMASPDVDRQQVRESLIAGIGAPVTIYVSTDDQPLSASWRMHGLPRAGDLSGSVTGRVPHYYFHGIAKVELVNTAKVRRDVLGHSDFIETEQGAGDLCRIVRGIDTKAAIPWTTSRTIGT